MNLKKLGAALHEGRVLDLNIITHSGLNRYAVRVVTSDALTAMVMKDDRRPMYWSSLAQLQSELRRHGITPPLLQVTVAQDEIIGR